MADTKKTDPNGITRRDVLKVSGLALGGLAAGGIPIRLFGFAPAVGTPPVDYWTPYVTDLTTVSATINWRGSNLATGSVEYATASYYNQHQSFNEKTESATAGAYQHVSLTNLEPNTSYVYRAEPSDNPDEFGNRAFQTMPVSGPFTFLVISDTHAEEKRFKWVADAINQYENDALFILDGGDYASFDYEDYWSVYFQYGDGMFSKFPIFHTMGNHEYHNVANEDGPPTKADQYHWTYDVPSKGSLNYSFDCCGVRFVVLDSPDPKHANGDDPQPYITLTNSQVPWLTQQLDNNMAGTFTIHHHPIWDYGRVGVDPNLGPWGTLYQNHNISANFAGHTHNYQRYSVMGIPYFVVGNAGGKFADMMEGYPHAVWFEYGDPANNTATAQEIFVAYVDADDAETATAYDPPIVADTITFPLASTLRTLTVTKSGLGSGTVVSSSGDINCGDACQAKYKKPTRVVLNAVPDAGSFFAGWTGACKGVGPCSVVVSEDLTVGAVFETGCEYSFTPASKSIGYQGGKITLTVTAQSAGSCPAPEVENSAAWITYTMSAFTKNKGTITLTVAKNTDSAARTSKDELFIGGNSCVVNQAGKP
jgi:hypothetical protein